jgi:hypothetical protein
MKRAGQAVVVAAIVLFLAVPGWAAGPYDGLWLVLQSSPTKGAATYALSIHENDEAPIPGGFNMVAVTLNLDATWTYSLGAQANGAAQGTVFGLDQVQRGTFSVTFTSPTTFAGRPRSGTTHST